MSIIQGVLYQIDTRLSTLDKVLMCVYEGVSEGGSGERDL